MDSVNCSVAIETEATISGAAGVTMDACRSTPWPARFSISTGRCPVLCRTGVRESQPRPAAALLVPRRILG